MKTTKHTLAGLRPVAIILASLFTATAAQAQQEDGSLPLATGQHASASFGSAAYGNGTTADNRSVAAGSSATAKSDSVAIGFDANAANINNIAVGSWAKASGVNGIAIGSQASASATNSVALGVKSVADRDNTVSVGAGRKERQIVNVRAGTEATDAVNLAQLDEKVQASNNRTDDQIHAEQKQREAGDVQTLNNAKEYTDGREKAISEKINIVDKSLNDTIVAQVHSEAIARNQAIASASQGVNDRTDGLIKREQDARAKGDADTLAAANGHSDANDVKTLASANGHTDSSVSASNTRTDGLIKTEQSARAKGDADTLAAANGHSDANDAKTLASANGHTDRSVNASNQRTDGMIKTEQDARAKGDTDTLAAANSHSDANDAKTLASANKYTDSSAKTTLKKANSYTDSRIEYFGNDVLEKSYSYTDRRSVAAENNAVNRANRYTDNKFRQLGSKIDRAEKRLNAGIAGVTAIASIPYVAENNFSYGIGLGNYQNGNAAAAGIQYKTSPNTNVRLNVSWDSSHNSALGIGIAGGW